MRYAIRILWYISDATISSRFIWFQVVNRVSTKENIPPSVGYFLWYLQLRTEFVTRHNMALSHK